MSSSSSRKHRPSRSPRALLRLLSAGMPRMARPVPAQVQEVQSSTLAAGSTTPSRSVGFFGSLVITSRIIVLHTPICVDCCTSDVAPISCDMATTTNASVGLYSVVHHTIHNVLLVVDDSSVSLATRSAPARPFVFIFTSYSRVCRMAHALLTRPYHLHNTTTRRKTEL